MIFSLIHDYKQLIRTTSSQAYQSLYGMMDKMRNEALNHKHPWSNYATFQDYNHICFWGIRKIEYGFIAEQFTAIEAQKTGLLRILDVGCGVVPLNNWMSNRGHEVVALDPRYEDIEFLVKNNMNQFYNSKVNYLTAAGEGLPFRDQSFDIVTSVSVLEHTVPGNDRVILDEIARVLKPDGHLLITFDVSPLLPLQDGEIALPEGFRRFDYPFHPLVVHRLFEWLSRYFKITTEDVPSELYEMTWEEVQTFWKAMQEQDEREDDTRDYLALGSVLPRNARPFQQDYYEMLRAYQEGQLTLEQRLSFYRHHADRRIEVIRSLQNKLIDKEKIQEHNRILQEDNRILQEDNRILQEKLLEQENIIHGFRTSHFYWIVNGPFERLPGLQRIASVARAVRSYSRSKLGVLEQHPPRPLLIPGSYSKIFRTTTNTGNPSISMVTPSYNQGKFIARTIRSVLDQKYPALEYIIQDGNSKDGTLDVLQSFQKELAYFESRQDNGQAHAINLGFQRTSGEIMAYLNSDDILLPGTLRYVADYFTSHPLVDVIYSHRVIINEIDEEIGRWVLPAHDNEVILWADYVPQETMFWRRSLWEKAGSQMDESYQFALDWDLIVRFRAAGAKFVRVPRFLSAFRVHTAQKTSMHIGSSGLDEMNRLRKQIHNRDIDWEEIPKHTRPYLRRSILYHKLYRLGVLRY